MARGYAPHSPLGDFRNQTQSALDAGNVTQSAQPVNWVHRIYARNRVIL